MFGSEAAAGGMPIPRSPRPDPQDHYLRMRGHLEDDKQRQDEWQRYRTHSSSPKRLTDWGGPQTDVASAAPGDAPTGSQSTDSNPGRRKERRLTIPRLRPTPVRGTEAATTKRPGRNPQNYRRHRAIGGFNRSLAAFMICIAEAYGRGSDLSKGTALTCSLTNKTTLSCACSPENGQYALISQPLSNLVFNCTRCHRNLLRQPHCGNVSVHEDSHHIILSRSQEFPGKDYYCHIHQCIAVGGYHGQDRAGDRTPVTSSGMGQNGTHKSTSDAKGTETVAVDGLGLGLGIVGLVSVAIALGFLVRFCWKKRVKKIKQGGGLMNECVPGSVQSSRSILTEPASDA